jgi:glycosyltransferase involved in cell wall biosynthesis
VESIEAFFSGKPIQTGYFYRCKVRRKIQAVAKSSCPDHVYCQLLRMAEYAVRLPLPRTIDYQDVFSMGMKDVSTLLPGGRNLSSGWKTKRLLRYENRIFEYFGHHSIISVPDRDLIPHPLNKQIAVIPNGVDHAYFIPLDRPKKYDIVFTGNMGYPPNIDAALFLSEEIVPLVLKEIPSARLLIAGATPHPRVRSLQSERITVSGWVPDIRESYASSRIFIAPMRIGTGLQNKLLEAMAMGIPCVTSPLANNALEAVPGTEILIGKHSGRICRSHGKFVKKPGTCQ